MQHSRTSAWVDISARVLFPCPRASHRSEEAGLENGHLTLSHVCANYFDTGKSTVRQAVLEDCHTLLRLVSLPFVGMKNMPGIIFLPGNSKSQQTAMGWRLPGSTSAEPDSRGPHLHLSQEPYYGHGARWSQAEIMICRCAWLGRAYVWAGQISEETNILWCHRDTVWQPTTNRLEQWEPKARTSSPLKTFSYLFPLR